MTPPDGQITTGERFADWVTAVVGSWPFIIWQAVMIAIWMWANWDGVVAFDPAPFIGLNLLLSFEAAFTAPFLLMSANRQAALDRRVLVQDASDDAQDLVIDKDTNERVARIEAILERLNK